MGCFYSKHKNTQLKLNLLNINPNEVKLAVRVPDTLFKDLFIKNKGNFVKDSSDSAAVSISSNNSLARLY